MFGFLGNFYASYFKQQPFRIVSNQDLTITFSVGVSSKSLPGHQQGLDTLVEHGKMLRSNLLEEMNDLLRKRRCFKKIQVPQVERYSLVGLPTFQVLEMYHDVPLFFFSICLAKKPGILQRKHLQACSFSVPSSIFGNKPPQMVPKIDKYW